jgi:hypothetical protein
MFGNVYNANNLKNKFLTRNKNGAGCQGYVGGGRKSRKSRKSRKNRRQSGGRHMLHEGSPLNSPNMLLSKSDAATAGTADFNSNRLN